MMSQQVGPLQLLPGERRGWPCKGGAQKQHRVEAEGRALREESMQVQVLALPL